MIFCLAPASPPLDDDDDGGGATIDDGERSGSVSPLAPPFRSEESFLSARIECGADRPCDTISEEVAQKAVALTEYFQEQRKVYEQVSPITVLLCC